MAHAQTSGPSTGGGRLMAQAQTDQTDAKTQALQAAIDSKDPTAQLNLALAVIPTAPGGLAIVANLLSNSPTGGFGFPNVTTLALVNLVVAENQNQTQASQN